MTWRASLFGDVVDRQRTISRGARRALEVDLGDIIGTEGDAIAGRAAVKSMVATWQRLGSPAQFKAAVETIQAQLADVDDWYAQIPFSPAKGQIKDIGDRAEKLEQQIIAAAGGVAPAASRNLQPGPSEQLAGTGKTIAVVAALGGLAWLAASSSAGASLRRRIGGK